MANTGAHKPFPLPRAAAGVGRREFIMLLGGTFVWPLPIRAQQPERTRRIGVLMQYSEGDPEGRIRVQAWNKRCKSSGGERAETCDSIIAGLVVMATASEPMQLNSWD